MSHEFEKKREVPQVLLPGNHLRSMGEQNGRHCLGEETIPKLTKPVIHNYFNLLTAEGVPEDDAREAARRMRSFAAETSEADVLGHQNPRELQRKKTAVNTVMTVLDDLKDLIGMRRTESQSITQNTNLGESIPIGQEITVYSRK